MTWNQDRDLGPFWKAMKGGVSKTFAFPAVKSKTAEKEKPKEKPKP